MVRTAYITVTVPTAVLSGNTTIVAGNSAFIKSTFTGKSPWSITYSDGTNSFTINNITSNPYYFSVSPSQTTTYFLNAINDADCAGTFSGNATITVTSNPATNTGLVGCYPLDNSANDYSGNNYKGTATNVTATTDRFGNVDKAYNFSGTGSFISIPDSAYQLNEFTYSVWCKLTSLPSTGTYYCIMAVGGSTADQSILIGNDPGNSNVGFCAGSWDALSQPKSCCSGFLPTINQWYHIVFTRNNTNLQLFIDDTLICTQSTGNNAGYIGAPLLASIGSRLTSSVQNFKGNIDNVKIFNRVLTLSEIVSLSDACLSLCNQSSFQKTFGGSNNDRAYSVIQNPDNTFMIAGETSSFGNGGSDGYLIKTDMNGNVLWSKTYGGTGNDLFYDVISTTDGGYAMSGYTASFGSGGKDSYIVKIDSVGNVQWSKAYGGGGDDNAKNIKQTFDGGFILADNLSTLTSIWVLKTDFNGNIQWSKTIGGADKDFGGVLEFTNDGGYLIGGATQSFGAGMFDGYLIKLDSIGNLVWNKTIGANNDEAVYSIHSTFDNGFIVAVPSHSFSTGAGDADIILVKINENGDTLWTKIIGGIEHELYYCILETQDNNILIGGYTASFGNGGQDLFIAKTDYNGDILWFKTYGGTNNENSFTTRFLIETNDSGIAMVGSTGSFGNGNDDMYFIKTDACGNALCNISDTLPIVRRLPLTITDPSPTISSFGTATTATTIATTPATLDSLLCSTVDSCNTIAAFTMSDTSVCNGDVIVFTNNSINATQYEWRLNDIFYSNSPDTGIILSTSGTYNVKLIAGKNNCVDSSSKTITVYPNVTASFMVNDTLICDSVPLFFTNTSINATQYEWRIDSTYYNNAVNVFITFNISGIHTVTLLANNAECADTFSMKNINVISKFVADAWSDTTICKGDSVQLFSTAGISHFWSPSVGLSDTVIPDPFTKTDTLKTYRVIVTAYGCPPDTAYVTVNVHNLPTADAGTDTTINAGNITQLNACCGTSYSWSPTTGLSCSDCKNPDASPTATTTYYISVTDTNECSNFDSVTVFIKEIECGEVFLPNAFSPNNDGENDLECIFGNCIQTMHLSIYNRWGERVFETDKPKECWDGTYKGKVMNTAVFVYYLNVTLITGEKINKQGNINLIR